MRSAAIDRVSPRRRARLTRRAVAGAAAGAMAAAAVIDAAPARAQSAPAVFSACYVPSTGTVYRIDKPAGSAPGAPAACLTQPGGRPPHVEFNWTDGLNAVRSGDAAGGDLGGTFPNPSVLKLLGRDVAATAPADGQVYSWDAANSQWKPTTPSVSGPAGGDLAGTYPNPGVAKLQGTAVAPTAPTSGQVLAFNGTAWAPTTPAAAPFATSTSTPNTLVLRDGSGGFETGRISVGTLSAHTVQATAFMGTPTANIFGSYLTLTGGGIEQDGRGIVSKGTFGTLLLPVSGPGVRLVWHPGRAAFRAGQANGTEWDDVNIGGQSVAMGLATTASAAASFAMGWNSTASGPVSVALGFRAVASGNSSAAIGSQATASGEGAVAIGSQTTASGNNSVALGSFASTNGKVASFVYGDLSAGASFLNSTNHNQFMVRAAGGTIFYSAADLSTGVSLAPGGGSWASVSDRRRKELFASVDAEWILRTVTALDIPSWSYKGADPARRYIGPTAQDFRAAFGLGTDSTIATQDMDGVTLAAVQALGRRTDRLAAENAALARENTALRAEVARARREHAALARRLARLEARPGPGQ